MPALALAGAENKRLAGNLPKFLLRNFYVEADPSNSVDGVVRLQRPGLEDWLTVGSGPINAVFQQDGTFGGDWFVVSGVELWRINSAGVQTFIGNIAGERAQIVGTADDMMIVNGGFARIYDGTSLRTIIMPDGVLVQSVAYLAGYWVLTVMGTQRVYFMLTSALNPDPLDFFEAERLPDAIIAAAVNGDELWLLGVETEEIWVPSGDSNAPFDRAPARAYENGCLARDAVVATDNAMMWVSRDFQVMMAQGVPRPISTPAIAEAMRRATPDSMRAWAFKLDSHVFYVLTTNLDTLVYDMTNGVWARWSSGAGDTWRAHLGSGFVAGDDDTGNLFRLAPRRSNDAGAVMTREITGGVEIIAAPAKCLNVAMRVAVGNTASLTAAPRLELRWSDDEGNTWSERRAVTLGLQGQYRAPVVWRKLGLMRRPGRLFEFRATDDVEFRISHATYNEAIN